MINITGRLQRVRLMLAFRGGEHITQPHQKQPTEKRPLHCPGLQAPTYSSFPNLIFSPFIKPWIHFSKFTAVFTRAISSQKILFLTD
jgi:hypothetical protein